MGGRAEAGCSAWYVSVTRLKKNNLQSKNPVKGARRVFAMLRLQREPLQFSRLLETR